MNETQGPTGDGQAARLCIVSAAPIRGQSNLGHQTVKIGMVNYQGRREAEGR